MSKTQKPTPPPSGIALEADFTSGTLRFTDPEKLEDLVRIARLLGARSLHGLFLHEIETLRSVADIVLPSDDV